MSTPDPIVLLAPPFSGSARLAARLGCHPQLYAVPELYLFMADNLGELLQIFRLSQGPQFDGLLRAIAQLEYGEQTDASIARARAWLEQHHHWHCRDLLDYLVQKVAPRRLLLPDVEAPLRPIELRRIQRWLPQAQILTLYRHPWTQGCLLWAWGRERLFIPPDFKDHSFIPALLDPQIAWLRAHANLQNAFAPRARVLRDEDFVADAASACTDLCRALEISTDSAALSAMQNPQNWDYAGHGPGTAPYGLEAEAFDVVKPRDWTLAEQTSLNKPLPWRPDGLPFDPQITTAARALGYE
ncbi:sulfotransferase [Sinimarinibacterium sp. NLF-5-8]|uniref:sulfotransferase n=1 Tax=Sinimarinibacterium sp. NLF-5-8 TaxID=2698684 RepID=UPI00137B9FA3|nr:sulfotransferase [Sinimarinibacterium sp. NLF-5-8]QHS09951.1 sulfotransferase [Sinimarinibacterium sp. NLF-5-8]